MRVVAIRYITAAASCLIAAQLQLLKQMSIFMHHHVLLHRHAVPCRAILDQRSSHLSRVLALMPPPSKRQRRRRRRRQISICWWDSNWKQTMKTEAVHTNDKHQWHAGVIASRSFVITDRLLHCATDLRLRCTTNSTPCRHQTSQSSVWKQCRPTYYSCCVITALR